MSWLEYYSKIKIKIAKATQFEFLQIEWLGLFIYFISYSKTFIVISLFSHVISRLFSSKD